MKAEGEEGDRDEMVGWHHQFNRHELGQTPGVGEGQGSLVCCSPWGHKESDIVTEQIKMNTFSWQDFLGGPAVKTPCFHCRGNRFSPWLGN